MLWESLRDSHDAEVSCMFDSYWKTWKPSGLDHKGLYLRKGG